MDERKHRILLQRMERLRESVKALRARVEDLKAANRALRKGSEFHRKLLDRIPSPVLVLQDGKVAVANRAAHLAVGYEEEVLTGRRFLSFVHPEEVKRAASVHRRLLAGKPLPDRYEARILSRDGVAKPYEIVVARILYHGRKAFLLSLWGLEERLAAEKARVTEERMKAVRAMAAGVADAVGGCLERLCSGIAEQTESDLETWTSALREAVEICERLSVLGRSFREQMPAHEAGSLIREAVARVCAAGPAEHPAEAGADVKTYLRTSCRVAGEREALVQALREVVANAVQAAGDGGNVYVSAEEEAGRVQVYVQDDGPGISPEIGEGIFDPFFSTGEGRGLGLTLARSVVEAHGGSLTYASKPGRGSTFRIQLPISPQVPLKRPRRARRSIKGVSLLVVTDEDLVGHFLCRFLSSAGARVRTVYGAAECLRALKRKRVDAVLLDLRNNGMRHAVLLSVLKRRDPAPRVVVIAPAGQDPVQEAWRHVDLVLESPLVVDRVPERIAGALSPTRRSS